MTQIRTARRLAALLALGLITCLPAGPALAARPADELQNTINKVLEVLKDPSLKGEAKKQERFDRLRTIIEPQFDFAEMARRSLGAEWQRRTPDEQKEFTKLFTDLVEKSYVDNIESYNGEKIIITNQKEESGGYAQVDTKIVDQKAQEYSVDYRLKQEGSGWKVYDVVIENISIVNNYRSQFNRVISRSSYNELVRRLRNREIAAPTNKNKS